MRVTKMHGAGNDFVIVNTLLDPIPEDRFSPLARLLCAYHTGVGADGMMVIVPPTEGGDYGMRFYNSDGSLGEMCGNGARCIAKYGHDKGLAGDTQRIETTAGLVIGRRAENSLYRVRLNDPAVIVPYTEINAAGKIFTPFYTELGDPGIPHAVVLLDEGESLDKEALRPIAKALRYWVGFKKGANVSFVKRISENKAEAITYERGVEDFTLACGTGCGSIGVCLSYKNLWNGENLSVSMPGGTLYVSLDKTGDNIHDIYLTGPAVTVFEGEINEEFLNGMCDAKG